MSGYNVLLAPAAERDIADAFVWYSERNALAAAGFRSEVYESIDRIAEAPLARPIDEIGNRYRVLHRFPYSIHYEVEGEAVVILAVAHHRRSPRYWRSPKP